MRNTLPHLMLLVLFTMTFCYLGCQRSGSDEELGTIVTDLSQVPGTETPYQLPDLGSKEAKKTDTPSTDPHDQPPASTEPSDASPHATPHEHP